MNVAPRLPKYYDPEECRYKHEHVDDRLEKLGGRINGIYVFLLVHALAALGALALIIIMKLVQVKP
jgi:hypothetical protein